jgi:flagellar assembly factor FliW
MKITLTRFGDQEMEINPENVITFPDSIAPFDGCTRYKLFHEEGKPTVFWLQSLDEPDLMFSVADPAFLKLSYEVVLSDEDQVLLKAEQGDEILLAVILYRAGENAGGDINAVSTAPIIINASKRLGMQKMLKELGAQVAIKGA